MGRVRGFSIATKCATVEELIEKYRDRVDDHSILVNAGGSREVGTEFAFAILLADKKVALAGTCSVLDVYTDANNPFQRPGMRLGIRRLGPESEHVFAELVKRRVPPRGLTVSVPIVRPAAVPMRAPAPSPIAAPDSARAASSAEPVRRAAAAPRVETRAPGSAYVLPANPLSKLTDASLEGFVDCRLLEAQTVQPPATFPTGTREELETVPPAPPPDTAPAIASAISPPARPSASAFAAPTHVEPMRSEPLPLPPPPPVSRPSAPVPLPYATTELPKLDVGVANDRVRANARIPLVPRRQRLTLLVVVTLVPLIGAAAVVAYMQLVAPVAATTPALPQTLASAELVDQARATIEPPPAPAAPEIPAHRQRIHAVLVKSYPIAARVTVGDRYFGTTPTYIKIPANTPVEVRIERRGFKPVTHPLISKRRTDRVFVRLQRARARR